MSAFLARLAERTAPSARTVAPKGLLSRAESQPEEPEKNTHHKADSRHDDEANRLRRADKPDKEEPPKEVQAASKKEDDKQEVKSLRRAAEQEQKKPGAKEGSPKDEDGEAQALRHAEAGDENKEKEKPEEAKALHRAEDTKDKKEDEQPKALHRAEAKKDEEKPEAKRAEAPDKKKEKERPEEARPLLRDSSRLEDPDDAPKPEQTREDQEPNQLTALRRELATAPPAGPAGPAPSLFHDAGDYHPFGAGVATNSADGSRRPTVQIDRLDVVVQEPASSPARAGLDRARSISARYLRRL